MEVVLFKKSQRIAVIFSFILQLLFFSTIIAAEGPSQPEALQFEPVDVTDLVNLTTGDFVYSLPLMTVPGPEGGYPISMSYHAGIGPNQEATWVGLGWTLNAGAVNRFINGYPDDLNTGLVQTHYEAKQKNDDGLFLSLGYGPVGIDMAFSFNRGFLGVNGMSIIGGTGFTINANVAAKSSRVGIGYSNLKLSLNSGDQATSLTVSVSLPHSNGSGFSIRFQDGKKTNGKLNLSGVGFSSTTPSSGGTTSISGGMIFGLPIGNLYFGVGIWSTIWTLNESYNDYGFGYLNQKKYHDSGLSNKKYERILQGNYIYSAQDNYTFHAEGLGGNMMPLSKHPYTLKDKSENTEKGFLLNTSATTHTKDNNSIFKIIGDAGSNYATDLEGLYDNHSEKWGEDFLGIYNNREGSNIVEFEYDDSGLIEKFIIIKTDGIVYEYSINIKNQFFYSKTKNTGGDWENYSTFDQPYTSNWLLTSIKGPDYIDLGTTNIIDDQDIGYWVKFNYTETEKPSIWRSPYTGYIVSQTSKNVEQMSTGIRSNYYLESIETKTHKAVFTTIDAKDRYITPSLSDVVLYNVGIDINNYPLKYYFSGNWESDISQITGDELLIYVKATYEIASGSGIGCSPLYREGYLKKNMIEFKNVGNQTEIVDSWSSINYPESIEDSEANCNFTLDKITAKMYIGNVVQNNYTPAKVLEKIELFSKLDLNNPLKTVKLDTDYSLAKGAPSSDSNGNDNFGEGGQNGDGKLTLNAVHFLGKTRSEISPPYMFEYANNDPAGSGFNPNWHKDDWDNWGNYRSPGSATERDNHITPQETARADKGAAYSLTKIYYPQGGTLNIEYESDDYYYVGDTFDFNKAQFYNIMNPGISVTRNYIMVENASSLGLQVGEDIFIEEEEESWVDPSDCKGGELEYSSSKYYYIIKTIDHISTDKIYLKTDYSFQADEGSCSNASIYNYRLLKYPSKIFGGGIRVKSLKSSSSGKTYVTNYLYENDKGNSTGTTPSLPALYGEEKYFASEKELFGPSIENYYKSYLDHEKSYKRPGPSIIYSLVEVENTDGSSINGKTRYEFYTSKNDPYEVIESISNIYKKESNIETNFDASVLTINDYSIKYGALKKTTYFEQYEDGTIKFRPVRSTIPQYSWSIDLKDNVKVSNKNTVVVGPEITDSEKYPLGLTIEKYKFINEEPQNNLEIYTERLYHNIFEIGIISDEYIYSSEIASDFDYSISTQSKNFIYDALTGQPLATTTFDSKGNTNITKSEPAYWHYPDMEYKNMLTQGAVSSTYHSGTLNSSSNLTLYDFPPSDLISSTITTWKDWDVDGDGIVDNVWRKNDNYVYNKNFNLSNTDPFPSFASYWNYLGEEIKNANSSIPWQMTNNITKYDKFSRVIESRTIDKTYSSAIYGYDDALPIAITSNAPLDQTRYYNFEKNTPSDSKTGRSSGSYNSGTQIYDDADNVILAPSITPVGNLYKVTYWYKTGTDWQEGETTLSPGNPLILGGTGMIDDIRIYPINAQMATYSYDPLTWQVTAITDANNVTTHYQYDDAGRLTHVLDDDNKVVGTHTYKYGRNEE
jgi:YD repeat-containing protein